MSEFYYQLAVFRNNYRASSNKEYTEVSYICEQLYDVARENINSPEELPAKFYLRNVSLKKDVVDNILKKIGINAETKVVNSGSQYGDMYEVVLK